MNITESELRNACSVYGLSQSVAGDLLGWIRQDRSRIISETEQNQADETKRLAKESKVDAVRYIRSKRGYGLHEAIDYVDRVIK